MFGPKLPPSMPPPSRPPGQFAKRETQSSHDSSHVRLNDSFDATAGSSTSSACFPPPEKVLRKKSKEKKSKNKKQHKHKKEKVKTAAGIPSVRLDCV